MSLVVKSNKASFRLVPFLGSTTTIRVLIGTAATVAIAGSVVVTTFPSQSSSHQTSTISRQPIMLATSSSDDNKTTALSTEETKTAKLWNRFADGYAKSPISDEASYQTKLQMTRNYLNPTTSKLLELGCGTGGTAISHAPYVKTLHAIDVSSRMIELADEKLAKEAPSVQTKVKFECMGIDALLTSRSSSREKKAPHPYNVVLGMSILHLLPNKNDVIRKVHQLLAPGGYFVSSTICLGDRAVTKWMVGYLAPLASWMGIIPQIHVFTKAELRASLEEAGFEIECEFHPDEGKAVFFVARKV